MAKTRSEEGCQYLCMLFSSPPLRGMRLATLLILIVCTHASARSYSQLVSFSGHNVPLQIVFNSLEKQTGMAFFYNSSLLIAAKPVTAEFKDIPLEDALNQILKNDGLDFYFSGKTIFIVRKQHSAISSGEIAGVATGVPVRNIKGKVTNQQGEPLV